MYVNSVHIKGVVWFDDTSESAVFEVHSQDLGDAVVHLMNIGRDLAKDNESMRFKYSLIEKLSVGFE